MCSSHFYVVPIVDLVTNFSYLKHSGANVGIFSVLKLVMHLLFARVLIVVCYINLYLIYVDSYLKVFIPLYCYFYRI